MSALLELVRAHQEAAAELTRKLDARVPLLDLAELTRAALATRAALVSHLAAVADGVQAATSDGRALTLTPSAQKPGQWQLTRFDLAGEPFGDSHYFTKASALDDFVREADLTTLAVESAGESAAGAPVPCPWHTPIPAQGLAVQSGDAHDYRAAVLRIARSAYDALTREQLMGGAAFYAYVLPATGGRHGAVVLVAEDQTPPKPWALMFGDGLRVAMLTREAVEARLIRELQRQPVLCAAAAPSAAGPSRGTKAKGLQHGTL